MAKGNSESNRRRGPDSGDDSPQHASLSSSVDVRIGRIGNSLFLFACISSVALMWPMFVAGPLVLDEHGSYWILDSDLPGTSLERSLNHAAIPPLSSWLQQLSISLFGKTEAAFRLPSAVCHLAAAMVVYFPGRLRFGNLAAGLAAVLLVWHPEALDEVRIARCYGLVLLLSALVLMMTLGWCEQPSSWLFMVGWVVAAAGLLWTHYTSVLLVFAAATCVLLGAWRTRQRRSRAIQCWFWGMVLMVVGGYPLIPSVLRLQQWGPFLNYMSADQSLLNFFGPLWWLGLPLGLSFCWLSRRPTDSRSSELLVRLCVLAACSVLALLSLALLSQADMPSLANPRYRVAYVPAGACLLACLLAQARSARLAVVTMVALLVVGWSWAPLLPWQTGRLGDQVEVEWYELAQKLQQESLPDEVIFVQSGLVESGLVPAYMDDPLFMEYVACRVSRFYVDSRHPRIALPFLWKGPRDVRGFYRQILDHQVVADACFWVAVATDTDLNRNSLFEIRSLAADAGFELVSGETWPNAVLEKYIRRSAAEGSGQR